MMQSKGLDSLQLYTKINKNIYISLVISKYNFHPLLTHGTFFINVLNIKNREIKCNYLNKYFYPLLTHGTFL